MAAGWHDTAPRDALTLLPALRRRARASSTSSPDALGGTTVALTVSDPLGREVPAAVLVIGRPEVSGRHTSSRRRPQACTCWPRTSATPPHEHLGVGQLCGRPSPSSRDRIVVGLGGSGTNDGGAGLLAALGAGPTESLARGASALASGPRRRPVRAAAPCASSSPGVELVIATRRRQPAARLQGRQRGLRPAEGRDARARPGARGCARPVHRDRRAHRARAHGPAHRRAAAARPRARSPAPPGGLGYALFLLGGRRVSGVELVLEAVGLPRRRRGQRPRRHGGGHLRLAEPQGKVAAGVAVAALDAGLPERRARRTGPRRAPRDDGAGDQRHVCRRRDPASRSTPRMLDPVGTLRARAARVAGRGPLLGDRAEVDVPWRTHGNRSRLDRRCDLMHDPQTHPSPDASQESPMSELDTQAPRPTTHRADARARRPPHRPRGGQGQVAARAGGSRRPAPARRRPARRLLRPHLPALLRRAHPRR